MPFDSRRDDPGAIPRAGRRGLDPLEGAIGIWQTVIDRFFRRRFLAWTVWLGFWAVPGAALAVLSANDDFLLSTENWVACPVVAFSLALYWSLYMWARFTARSHRRDHALGYWLNYRIYGRLHFTRPSEERVAELAGHWTVLLDIWVPFAITSVVYGAAVIGVAVRILQNAP